MDILKVLSWENSGNMFKSGVFGGALWRRICSDMGGTKSLFMVYLGL